MSVVDKNTGECPQNSLPIEDWHYLTVTHLARFRG